MQLRLGPTLCLVLALVSVAGLAADAATAQIVAQARYWEQKGRHDLARESWLKLLRANPHSAEALAGLASAEIRSGRPEMARQYLQGLRALQPDHPDLQRLETAVATGAASKQAAGSVELARARELARLQRYDAALTEYQRLFDGRPPDGPLALEYWQTMAGAEGGWTQARAGLEKLVEAHPENPDYRVALAQLLTYRENTRRQGLEQLMELAEVDAGRQPVQPIWRQALLWLGRGPRDARYYRAYLHRYGDDTQVALRLASTRAGTGSARVDARGRALKKAWALLDDGRTEEAENAFAAMRRRNPRDAEALAGLGILRLRQGRFGEAREYLQQASRQSPRRARHWAEALASARFWEQVHLAEADREAARLPQAEERLRSAIEGAPAIAAREASVRLTLADILLAQGRAPEAESIYRDVLGREPGNVDAARGLMGALAQGGRLDDALLVYRELPPAQQASIETIGALRAQVLRRQATQVLALEDEAGAERLLREALVADPEGTWPRLDLARLYLRQGRRTEARNLIDGLPTQGPRRGEAAHIRALVAAGEQDWYDGLMWLEQVPEDERSDDMAALQQRLWVRYQAERAAAIARRGRREEALALLADIQPHARSAEGVGAVAFAHAEAGEPGRGLQLLRQERVRRPEDSDLQLTYAGMLLKLQEHAELDAVLDPLADGPRLDARQERTLAQMRIAQRVQQADDLRLGGDIARAYDLLEPALRDNPGDPRLAMAMGRLYGQAGEHDRAIALYRYALELDAGNLDAYQGVVQSNLARGREGEADRWLDEAFRIAPDSGRLHALAGRVAVARGQDGRALQFFRRALELGPDDDGGGHGALRLQRLDAQLRPLGPAPAGARGHAHPAARGDLSLSAPHGAAVRPAQVDLRRPEMAMQEPDAAAAPPEIAQAGPPPLPPIPRPGEPVPDPTAPAHSAADASGSDLDLLRRFRRPLIDPEAMQLHTDPVPGSRDHAREPAPLPATPTDRILAEIEEIKDRRAAWVAAGVGLRHREGRSGLDRLDDIETPIELSFAAPQAGRVNLRVVPVFLDADTVEGGRLPLFGTLAFADTTGRGFEQDDAGVALGASYQLGQLTVDVGSTPIGFEVGSVVGGIRWTPRFDNWVIDADISRRPVTDSLLSYAGTRDPASERDFGGVTASGGRLEVAYDLGQGGLYAQGGFDFYEGEHVEDNTEASVGAGAYLHVFRNPIQRVTVGLNLTSFFFDENLRHFTLGHGGYFSPQRYLAVSTPVEWVGGRDRHSWKIHGAIGLQDFHEDRAPLYPEDDALQAAIEAFAADNPDLGIATGYGSNSHTGAFVSLGGQVEYRIAPQLVIGARASFDDARDYEESRVLAYLRWSIGRRNAVAVPPRPVVPFADYGRKLP